MWRTQWFSMARKAANNAKKKRMNVGRGTVGTAIVVRTDQNNP